MQRATFDSQTWPDDVIQLLDDHHLVVLSGSAKARQEFGATLQHHLNELADTEVVWIDGGSATNLPNFCRQLDRHLQAKSNGSHSPSVRHVVEALRCVPSRPKRRYFLWHEAHAMLEADVDLFCRLVNAFFGIAAESEHINLEPLVLQRIVFIGGEKLGAYAEDQNGQFNRWLDDGEDSPFWEVASVLERPPVITYRIDG